jgi:hypothetical protein
MVLISDWLVLQCLHLIGLALHEEKRSFQAGNAASPFSFFTKVTSGEVVLKRS